MKLFENFAAENAEREAISSRPCALQYFILSTYFGHYLTYDYALLYFSANTKRDQKHGLGGHTLFFSMCISPTMLCSEGVQPMGRVSPATSSRWKISSLGSMETSECENLDTAREG